MHSIGDFVIKPNTGICRIASIEMMNLGGGEKAFYVLLPIRDERAKFFVPADAERARIRAVMTKEEAKAFISAMPGIEELEIVNEKAREQQYKAAILSNEPRALVEIIKNLHQRKQRRVAQGKKVTATDEKYFRQAESALFAELSFSLKLSVDDIHSLIAENIKHD